MSTRKPDTKPAQEPRRDEPLDERTLDEIAGGGLGSWSWRAFNPQPEPPATFSFLRIR